MAILFIVAPILGKEHTSGMSRRHDVVVFRAHWRHDAATTCGDHRVTEDSGCLKKVLMNKHVPTLTD
ncbi:hypothetical protein E2C01_080914 [Portunus trituberculatus]|uniref:Uncharacterized protein n=1 Tax=Portunus trituberculatus TaxID=210409 RepID=A0A5B7IV90_PORTR|nr:hypothetical protein [Portunus trituberculatus]